MILIFNKKKRDLVKKTLEVFSLNQKIEKIDESILDAIIWNDRNGRFLHETEKRMILEKRNELIETLKQS